MPLPGESCSFHTVSLVHPKRDGHQVGDPPFSPSGVLYPSSQLQQEKLCKRRAFSSQFHKKLRRCREGCCFWVSTGSPFAEGFPPAVPLCSLWDETLPLSKDNHFEVSSEKSIPSSRGHCTSWCIFNPKQLRDGVIPLITAPGELRSQSHSSWHFTSCPPLCLCSQLAAGSKFGHMQDKFLQGCEWSAQKLPQIVMRAARFTQVFCHQRTQKSFSRSSSFGRDSLVCANVPFSLVTPEIGGDLHSDPASLGTTNTGTVCDLDGSPVPHCLAHPRDPYSRAETAWSTSEVFATQGKRGRA